MAVDYVEDPITHIVRIIVDTPSEPIAIGLSFGAFPTHFYLGGEPHVATLSVAGLPLLTPNEFKANMSLFGIPPPFYEEVYRGGSTRLNMPDGTGTLDASWSFAQPTPEAGGAVGYHTTNTFNPFLGQNHLVITVTMQLRPLSFLEIGSEDNHYNWSGGASVSGLPGVGPIAPISGRAESAGVLTFTLAVTLRPPSAVFAAG